MYVCYTNNTNTSKMEELKNKLWDFKGYDLKYLNNLTNKEIKVLYDTEFYYN